MFIFMEQSDNESDDSIHLPNLEMGIYHIMGNRARERGDHDQAEYFYEETLDQIDLYREKLNQVRDENTNSNVDIDESLSIEYSLENLEELVESKLEEIR